MSTTTETKDLIKAGRAEIKDLNAKMDAITASGWMDGEGNLHVRPEAASEFKTLLKQAEETHSQVSMLERKGNLDQWLDGPADAEPAALRAGAGRSPAPGQTEFK